MLLTYDGKSLYWNWVLFTDGSSEFKIVKVTDVVNFNKALKKYADAERANEESPAWNFSTKINDLTDYEVFFATEFKEIFVEWYRANPNMTSTDVYKVLPEAIKSLSDNYLENVQGATKGKTLWDYTDKTPVAFEDIAYDFDYDSMLNGLHKPWENVFNLVKPLLANSRHYELEAAKQSEAQSQATTTTTPATTTSTTTSVNTPTGSETVTVSVNAPSDLLRLLRVNVTCLDPMKKEYKGEIFTVGNDVIGSVKKYVPFNTTDGWHVPAIIVQQLRDKECQIFQSVKNDKGQEIRTGKTIKAYIVQELPPLTPEELAELAKVQSAQGL